MKIMKTLKFLIITFLAVTFFVLGGKAANYLLRLENENERLHTELIGKTEEYRQIRDDLAQLRTDYVKQKDLAAEAKQRFETVLRNRDERIKVLSDATYLIGQHVSKQNGPDYYFETNRKTRNYVLNELRIQGPDSPPVGYILIKYDGRTYKRNYKIEINVENLQTIDEDTGRIKVYSKAYLVSKEESPLVKRIDGYKNWQNIKYPLKITGGTALIDPTIRNQLKPRLQWWAPHLNANFNFLGKNVIPGVGMSIAGYGTTKNDLDYRFLQLGIQYDKDRGTEATLTPVMWRPFSKVVSNTYLGPGVSSINGDVSYFLGLQVGF